MISDQGLAGRGPSDVEIYENLAESWVRLAQMNTETHPNTHSEYIAFSAVVEKLQKADSQSYAADLKIVTFATLTNRADLGKLSPERLKMGIEAGRRYLRSNHSDPYAGEMLASLSLVNAQAQWAEGIDPSASLTESVRHLESILSDNPKFLWAYNDLGNIYDELSRIKIFRGARDADIYAKKAISAYGLASRIDSEYENAYANLLWSTVKLVDICDNSNFLQENIKSWQSTFDKCRSINKSSAACADNFGILHSHIALRLWQAGERPAESLRTAFEYLGRARQLGGKLLDAEQHMALAYWVQATDGVERGEDPAAALREMEAALATCLELAEDDAMCRTLAARAEWVRADFALAGGKADAIPTARRALQAALAKSERASACKEKYPDAWQTLAETQLRLARQETADPRRREAAVSAGLAALKPGFAINPNHAGSHATLGKLQLLRATGTGDLASRKQAAEAAAAAFAAAMEHDGLLKTRIAPRLEQARNVLEGLTAAGTIAKPGAAKAGR